MVMIMAKSHASSARSLALAGLFVSIPGLGCASSSPPQTGCTEIGCNDGLTVTFAPNSGWAPGSYRFVVDIDGQTTTCEGMLPLKDCDVGPSLQCSPASGRLGIGESGCALPPAQQGFSELHLGVPPAQSVTITVSRDGSELVQKTLTPQYKTSQPNGPNCEPVCQTASETLMIPGATP
jgi:hypothetical protein